MKIETVSYQIRLSNGAFIRNPIGSFYIPYQDEQEAIQDAIARKLAYAGEDLSYIVEKVTTITESVTTI